MQQIDSDPKVSSSPRSGRRWFCYALILLGTLAAVGAFLFQRSLLKSGGRIEFGRSRSVPFVPPALSDALAADGVTLVDFRRHGHSQSFEGLLRVTRYKIVLQLSTSEKVIEPNSLTYALLDAQGAVLRRGTVRSAVPLAAGETGDFEIVDENVNEAFQAVIDYRK